MSEALMPTMRAVCQEEQMDKAIIATLFISLFAASPSIAQTSVACPISDKVVLSGKSDVSGTYRFAGAATVYVEGNSSSLLHNQGTMSAQLRVNDQQVSTASNSNPGNNSDTKGVTTSTTLAVQPNQAYAIRLTSTNSNGDAKLDQVKMTCK
jgi:hypothetical protein